MVDWAREYADLHDTMTRSFADDVAALRAEIAAEIEQFADDDSDISDAYRHAAMIAKGIPGA